MLRQLVTGARVTAVLLVLVSGLYPALVWGIGRTLFPRQAGGSLVRNARGDVVGSALLAQGFAKPEYFHPRPSAAGGGYDPTASGGTNLGPTSDKLIRGVHKPDLARGRPDPADFDGVADLAAAYRRENGLAADAPVPVDAVTRSASGLDPDVTLANARLQAARVAKARGAAEADVSRLIAADAAGRTLGLWGTDRVNVLRLNLDLDRQFPARAR